MNYDNKRLFICLSKKRQENRLRDKRSKSTFIRGKGRENREWWRLSGPLKSTFSELKCKSGFFLWCTRIKPLHDWTRVGAQKEISFSTLDSITIFSWNLCSQQRFCSIQSSGPFTVTFLHMETSIRRNPLPLRSKEWVSTQRAVILLNACSHKCNNWPQI